MREDLEQKHLWVSRLCRAGMTSVLTDAPKTSQASPLSLSNVSVELVGPCIMDPSFFTLMIGRRSLWQITASK